MIAAILVFFACVLWLTTNDLLEKIRRQGMTPAERKAEDARRARTREFFCAAITFALIILISAFFIFSANYNARVWQSEQEILSRNYQLACIRDDKPLWLNNLMENIHRDEFVLVPD